MPREVTGITLDDLERLPESCRRCVYWELSADWELSTDWELSPEPAAASDFTAGDLTATEVEKEAWVSAMLLEWGSCGRVAYESGVPVGFVLYGPPSHVPRSLAFPTSPVSADATLLTSFGVRTENQRTGCGRMLVQAAAADLGRRGVAAVEAFGATGAAPEAGSGGRRHVCVVPAEFLRRVGFKTVAPHHVWPRLRLELRGGSRWKEDVEAALDQLLAQVSVARPATSVPVGPGRP